MSPDRPRLPRDRRTDEPAIAIWVMGSLFALVLALLVVPLFVGMLGVPIGLPLALCVCALPIIRAWKSVVARERYWWALRGQCSNCGYDLRESTGRCPECGEAIDHAGGR